MNLKSGSIFFWHESFFPSCFISLNCHIVCLSCFIGIQMVANSGKLYKLQGIHKGLKSLLFFWLCRVEYSRAHVLRLPIRWADWNREADSPCFTLSLTSSHSALKCLTQSSGSLQETDLRQAEIGGVEEPRPTLGTRSHTQGPTMRYRMSADIFTRKYLIAE